MCLNTNPSTQLCEVNRNENKITFPILRARRAGVRSTLKKRPCAKPPSCFVVESEARVGEGKQANRENPQRHEKRQDYDGTIGECSLLEDLDESPAALLGAWKQTQIMIVFPREMANFDKKCLSRRRGKPRTTLSDWSGVVGEECSCLAAMHLR